MKRAAAGLWVVAAASVAWLGCSSDATSNFEGAGGQTGIAGSSAAGRGGSAGSGPGSATAGSGGAAGTGGAAARGGAGGAAGATAGGGAGGRGGGAAATGGSGAAGTGGGGATGAGGAAGGAAGTSAGVTCDSTPPCGGALVGTWSFASVCMHDAVAMQQFMYQDCPTSTITDLTVTQTGSVVFTAAGYAVALTRTYAFTYHIPVSCLGGLTCADLAGRFDRSIDLESSSCTGDTICICPIVYYPREVTESGSYTASGTTMRTTPTGRTTDTTEYCVEGDRLHILDVETIAGTEPMMMRTRSSQVARRVTLAP